MESHLVRIINRLETMTKDGGNLKRNFERDGVVVAEVAYNHNEEEFGVVSSSFFVHLAIVFVYKKF